MRWSLPCVGMEISSLFVALIDQAFQLKRPALPRWSVKNGFGFKKNCYAPDADESRWQNSFLCRTANGQAIRQALPSRLRMRQCQRLETNRKLIPRKEPFFALKFDRLSNSFSFLSRCFPVRQFVASDFNSDTASLIFVLRIALRNGRNSDLQQINNPQSRRSIALGTQYFAPNDLAFANSTIVWITFPEKIVETPDAVFEASENFGSSLSVIIFRRLVPSRE